MDSLPKFPLLNTMNYYLWKDNMEAALQLKELWHAVAEDTVYRALDGPAQAKMQSKARAVIVLMLSDTVKPMVKSKTTPKEVWDALKSSFHSQSASRKFHLRQQLRELRKKKSEDVLTYLSRAEQLKLKLSEACTDTVSDDDVVFSILDGLGPAFTEFVRQVRYGNEMFTLITLRERLLHVEQQVKRAERTSSMLKYPEANHVGRKVAATQRRAISGKSNSRPGSKICHHCGD